jgi:hypothetical protein
MWAGLGVPVHGSSRDSMYLTEKFLIRWLESYNIHDLDVQSTFLIPNFYNYQDCFCNKYKLPYKTPFSTDFVPELRQDLHDAKRLMCFFDQKIWACRYWKWGSFRKQCDWEHHIGKTCGLKLIFETIREEHECHLCDRRNVKVRRIIKLKEDIERWQYEGNRPASIERAEKEVALLAHQITEIVRCHQPKELVCRRSSCPSI